MIKICGHLRSTKIVLYLLISRTEQVLFEIHDMEGEIEKRKQLSSQEH